MPSEPENKMEDLLKSYAAKRRDDAGAPLALHPATRKLLQSAVARQHSPPAKANESWLRRLAGFWPRLAMATSLLVVLGFLAWGLSPPRDHEEFALAKEDKASPAPASFGRDLSVSTTPPSTPHPDAVALQMARGNGDRDEATLSDQQLGLALAPPLKESEREELDALASRRVALNRPTLAGEGLANAGKLEAPLSLPTPASSPAAPPQPSSGVRAVGESRSYAVANQPGAGPTPFKPTANGGTVDAPTLNYLFNGGPATNAFADGIAAGSALRTLPSGQLADRMAAKAEGLFESSVTLAKDGPVTTDALSIAGRSKVQDEGAREEARVAAAKPADAYFRQRLQTATTVSNAGTLRRLFVQATPASPARESKVAPATSQGVLGQFEVRQNGVTVQLIDSDGSVYAGTILAGIPPAPTGLGAIHLPAEPPATPGVLFKEKSLGQREDFDSRDQNGSQRIRFRVSGTSRHLGETVVVEGTLLLSSLPTPVAGDAPPQLQPAPRPSRALAPPSNRRPTPPASDPLSTRIASGENRIQRVTGRVRIGLTNELPLDALPAKNQGN